MPTKYPRRFESIVALENAIAAYTGCAGPAGKWSVDTPGRFFIALRWTGQFTTIPSGFTGNTPWIDYGGNEILKAAGLWTGRILAGDGGDGHYFSSALIYVQG